MVKPAQTIVPWMNRRCEFIYFACDVSHIFLRVIAYSWINEKLLSAHRLDNAYVVNHRGTSHVEDASQ